MKRIKVNEKWLHTSKGRLLQGAIEVLPDAEIKKLTAVRHMSLTVLGDVTPEPEQEAPAKPATKRKRRNA